MAVNLPAMLKDLRKSRGVGQSALAALAGVQQQSVSRWETGSRDPTFGNLMTIATVLDASRAEAIALLEAGGFDVPEDIYTKFGAQDSAGGVPRTTDERLDGLEIEIGAIKAALLDLVASLNDDA